MLKSYKENFFSLGLIYSIFALWLFPKWTVDDAFILYRYADNLAQHGQLTWNVGEDPIEGYTGIVMPLVLAFFIRLGIFPIVISKIIGLASFFFGGYCLYLILRKLGLHYFSRSMVLLLYFTAPFMFSIAWSGLETMLFTALLLATTCAFLTIIKSKIPYPKQEALFILLSLLTSLVRPEGVIFALASFIILVYHRWKYQKAEFTRFLFRLFLFYFLPGILYFLWRWNYYGLFLPNTFYAKASPHFWEKTSILKFILFFVLYIFLPALTIIILYLAHPQKFRKYFKTNYSSAENSTLVYFSVPIIVFVLLVLLFYFHSRLMMNFEYRFFAPFFPLILVFVALLLDAGLSTLKYLKSQKPVFFRILGIVLIIILLGQMLINNREYNKYVFLRDGYKKNIESSHIPAGIFLKHNVPSNEWLIVIHDTGAIPYNSGLKTIDFSRLNNETLAQKQFDSTEIVDYFYSINAGAVVITSYDWEKIHQPWIYGDEAAAIARDPRFANYQLIKKYRTDISPDHPSYLYYEFLFLRKDLAFALKTKDDAF